VHVIGETSNSIGTMLAAIGLEIIWPAAAADKGLRSFIGEAIGGLAGPWATAAMNRRQARRLEEDDRIRRQAREGYVPA
jgi:hypothetical protein